MKQRIEKLFSSKELAAVQESQEQTIEHGMSVVDQELFPLVEIVRKLRDTVLEVKEIRDTIIDREKICEQKAKYESRYKELAVALREMREKLNKEFPLSLYEKRIQDIMLSEKYVAQAKTAEKRERQKKIIIELGKIRSDLEKSVEDAKDVALGVGEKMDVVGKKIDSKIGTIEYQLSTVNNGINELKRDVTTTKSRVSDVNSKIDDMKRDVSDAKDAAQEARTETEDSKRRLRQISRDVITIRDNVRNNR